MAEKIRSFLRGLHLAYPRSVFDMSPATPLLPGASDDIGSLSSDWNAVCGDLRSAAWRVYINV